MKLHPQLLKEVNKFGLDKEKYKEFLEVVNKKYESDDQLETILNSMPCTVSVIDKNLTYLSVNEQLSSLLNKKPKDFVGCSLGELNNDERFKNFAHRIFTDSNNQLKKEVTTQIDGIKKSYLVIAQKYDNNEKAIIIGLDISYLKEMENQLAFSEKLSTLGEMTSVIMHEINNPITTVSLLCEELLEETQENSTKKFTIEIKNNLKILHDILKGIKKLSTQNNECKELNIKNVVNQSLIVARGKLKKSNISINVDITENFTMKASETEMLQVFLNLINNSCDAINDLNEKFIKIIQKENQLLFIDSGKGIDDSIKGKLLNKFFSTKEVGKGSGLGLHISKQILDKYNIDLKIGEYEENTCFYLTFPQTGE